MLPCPNASTGNQYLLQNIASCSAARILEFCSGGVAYVGITGRVSACADRAGVAEFPGNANLAEIAHIVRRQGASILMRSEFVDIHSWFLPHFPEQIVALDSSAGPAYLAPSARNNSARVVSRLKLIHKYCSCPRPSKRPAERA